MSDSATHSRVLSDEHMRRGAITLRLLVDPSWVHRRVDKAVHTDPVAVRRTKSIDFTLPHYDPPLEVVAGRRLDYALLGIMTKWRIVNVDVRDEGGSALPLIDRRQYTPIGVAMLVILAHMVYGERIPLSVDDSQVPSSVERDLWEIVGRREELALGVCEGLIGDLATKDEAEARWRKLLATDYVFMSLAWTLARGFLLLVPLHDSVDQRRIVKFGYDAYRYRARTEWRSLARIRRAVRYLTESEHCEEVVATSRLSSSGKDCDPAGGGHEAVTGRLLLRIVWLTGRSSTRPEPAATPTALFELTGADGRLLTLIMVGTETVVYLPPGVWYVRRPPIPGYEPIGSASRDATIEAETTTELSFVYREKPKRLVSSRPPIYPSVDSRLLWLLEEVGITSRRVMFSLPLYGRGSSHFQFEAPSGFVVTRIKLSLAGEGGRILDMSARSSQRADVYAFNANWPTRALVLANVRPRSDTIVDISWVTAVVTAAILTTYAIWHLATGRAPSAATTLILASPGALAAFAAQAPREVIVSRMTAGLRYFSLLPGLVAFGAATTAAAWPTATVGKVLQFVLAAVAMLIAILAWFAHHWTLRPVERHSWQGPKRDDGAFDLVDDSNNIEEDFREDALLDSHLDQIKAEIHSACCDDQLWAAYEVRARLRTASQPIPEDLRDEYLLQEHLGYGIVRPPSIFVDSGEVAPTFIGLYALQRHKLEAALRSIDVKGVDDEVASQITNSDAENTTSGAPEQGDEDGAVGAGT